MIKLLKDYPRYVTPNFKPYDPVELAKMTEKIVTRWKDNVLMRKYTDVYCAGVYGGIATAYAVGCCLRCIFCWVNKSRDFPEKYGSFYTPQMLFERLKEVAQKRGIRKARISGGEPTLGKQHLLEVLELIEDSNYFKLFILETNGIIFGTDKDYVRKIRNFDKVYVRISLKAGTPEMFTKKTGAVQSSFKIPFQAIRNLIDCGIKFHVAAMSADPRFMTPEERLEFAKKLMEIHPSLLKNLEEEVVDPYKAALERLRYANWKIEWPLRQRYTSISSLIERRMNTKKGG